jgi:hypothetical protein
MTVSPLDLLGTWVLDRSVDDRRTGERHTVSGSTTLEALGPDRVAWAEAGTMTTADGRSFPVQRRLDVVRRSDAWWVLFADGREFHPWSPGDVVVHDCAPDVYRGEVRVDDDGWDVVWEATGPAKDYRMVSRLTRVG